MARQKTNQIRSNGFLFVVKNAGALAWLALIPFGLLVRSGLIDNRFYAGDDVFGVIALLYLIASGCWFLYRQRAQSTFADIVFSVIFHLLVLAFMIYVSGFVSAFLVVWVVLAATTDVRFTNYGFLASFLSLGLAAVFNLAIHQQILILEQLQIAQAFIGVVAIGFVLTRVRGITQRERQALLKTREQEAYQRERLLALVNSMGDAVVATDEQGVIKVYNSTLLSLLDTNASLNGKVIDDILKLTDPTKHQINLISEAKSRHTVFSRSDLSYTFADHEKIRLYVNVAPIQPSYRSRAERGYIIILRDITKEKTLEEERDEFISVVSHELRTPVAIAEGGVSNIMLLQERGAAPEVIKHAAMAAHDQILYLSKLINDLSALSRAERGLGAEIEVVNITDLLHRIYTNYLPQAQAKKLALNLDIKTTHMPQIVSSRMYIEEIVQNLVTNALKYTREGAVTIHAARTKAGLLIEVKDTGIGISKADQKHIFEKFYRSEDYRTRESNGTGLGLYVCLKLAEKIGLSLTFDSRLNHGSTFTLTVPPKQFATGGGQVAAAPQQGSTHSGPSN